MDAAARTAADAVVIARGLADESRDVDRYAMAVRHSSQMPYPCPVRSARRSTLPQCVTTSRQHARAQPGARSGRWSRPTRTATASRVPCADSSAADGLALIDLNEARRARAAGWSEPMLLLEGIFDAADVSTCANWD